MRFGKNAKDVNDFLIYDRSTGNLFYDCNAKRTGGKDLFAQFDPGTKLTFADFDMI